MRLTLKRVSSDAQGTYGVLIDGTRPFAVTLERPWLNNERSVSCIPAGQYACRRVQSPKFGNTFEVTGVPGRTHILFHKGNQVEETQGCILVAEQFGKLGNGNMAVLQSGQGFTEFMLLLAVFDEFTIDILEV